MPIGSGIVYNTGDLILSQVSSSGTAFLETKIAAATSSIIYFDSNGSINSASLNSITVGTASYVSGSTSIITNLTASNISSSKITGSLFGTSSWAQNAVTALTSLTASNFAGYPISRFYPAYDINQTSDANTYYHLIGYIGDNNGSFYVKGLLGGHDLDNSPQGGAYIDLAVFSRYTQKPIVGTIYGNVGNQDLMVFASGSPVGPTSGNLYIYLKTTVYALADLQYAGTNGSAVYYNTTGSTSYPSGSLIFSASAYDTQVGGFSQITSNHVNSTSSYTASIGVIRNGNVGIGTISPAYKLDVSGSSRFGYRASDTHQFTGSVSLTDGLSLTNLTASNISASSITGSLFGTSSWSTNALTASNLFGGTSGYVARWTGTTSLGTGVIRDDGTQVGIATGPDQVAALTVNGNILFNNNYLIASSGSSTNMDYIGVSDSTHNVTNNAAGYWVFKHDTSLSNNSGSTSTLDFGSFVSNNANDTNYIAGKLGIGTTVPNSKLEVAGTTGNAIISIYNTTSARSGSFGIDASGVYIQNSNNGDYFDLKNASGTSKFRVVYDSNTYINTTYTSIGNISNSGSKLSVFGNLSVGSTTYGATAAPANGAIIEGNVGIGAINPSSKLDISGSTNITILDAYRNVASATNPLFYAIEANGSPGKTNVALFERLNNLAAANVSASSAGVRIREHSSNYALSVEDHSDNSYLVIKGGGNVGIGTTNPVYKLDVSGSSRHGYQSSDTHYFTGSVSFTDGLFLTNLTASNVSASGTGSFGIVGINTTSPGVKLDVRGQVLVNNTTASKAANQLTININGTNYAHFYDLGDSVANTLVLGGSPNLTTIPTSSISESVMSWQLNSGKVGIGTTSPSAKLTIVDNTNGAILNLVGRTSDDTAAINFRATDDASTYAYISPDTNEFRMYHNDGFMTFYPGGTEKVRITSGGNVGIGTSNPTNFVNSNPIYFSPSSSGTFLSLYSTNSDSNINLVSSASADGASIGGLYFTRVRGQSDAHYQIAAIKAKQSGTSTTLAGGSLYFYTKVNGSGTPESQSQMMIASDGNVGVGVNSPLGRLHITGSATNGETLLYLSKGTGSFSQNYINAVDQAGASNYRVTSDINGYSQQTLYRSGTSYVYHDAYWSSWINNANYAQGGFSLGTGSLTHGYALNISRPAVSGSLYVSGSSIFTGSINVNGSITASLFGTSSWANNVVSASYATTAQTANALNASNTYTIAGLTSAYVDVTGAGTIPTTGIYRPSTKSLGLSADGTLIFKISNAATPATSSIETGNFLVSSGNVGIGTNNAGYTLQIGQSTAADSTNYRLAILRNGTLGSPGSYQSNAFAIYDYATDGPASVDTTGIAYISAPRIATSDANADNASLLTVVNDSGHVLRASGKQNVYIGYTSATTSTQSNGLFVNGNLGLGTTNPGAKLEVNGNISGSSFTSSISNAVGFLGTSSWASNAVNATTANALSSMNISQFTNNSKYHYHRTDISSLSSSATNLVQPISTFDYNNATNGPGAAWYNYFSSTHGDYLTSLIANQHRTANWYVAYREGSAGTPTNPVWYALLHEGNYTTYTVTKTGTGASGTWSITSSWANALNTSNNYTVGSLTSTTQLGGSSGTLVSYVTPGVYATGTSTGNAIGIISNTTFANNGAIANIGLNQSSSNANDITAKVHMTIGGWYQNSGTGIPIYLGNGYTIESSPTMVIAPADANGGGNVGIGTTNPIAKLHVVGNISGSSFTSSISNAVGFLGTSSWAQTANALNTGNSYTIAGLTNNGTLSQQGTLSMGSGYQILATTGTTSSPGIAFVGDTNTGIYSSGADTIGLVTGGSEKVRIDSNGNVGIGTSSPAQKLEVQSGSVLIRGDGNALFGTYYASAGENTFFTLHSGSGNTFHIGNDVSGTNYNTIVLTSATDSTGGKVGIGTSSPGSKLQINDTNPTLTLRANDGGTSRKAYIDFYTTFYNYPSDVGARRTSTIVTGFDTGVWGTEFLAFNVGSGSANDSALLPIERVRIDGSGNLGVGTSTVIGKLQVNSTAAPYYGPATSSANANGIFILGNTTTDVVNTFGVDATSTAYAWIQPRKSSVATYYSLVLNPNGGNVGIGTVTPAAKLEITGSSNSALLNIKSPISGAILYVSGSGAVGIGDSNVGTYRLYVSGSFGATTKSFIIDHPTKKGKKLIYGSLESPYHGIRLTGRDTLKDGKCKVELPEYIYKLILHDSVNIQLTGIKCNKTLYVDDINIPENYFTIAYDKALFESYKDYDFFWDFTAIRADVPELITEL